MPYSMDLRTRVVTFVKEGGSKAEASRRFQVCPATVYNWLNREDLRPTVVKRRQRKLDWAVLEQHVKDHPNARLCDRAAHFGVNIHAIWYALKQMKITRKKTAKVSRTQSSGTSSLSQAITGDCEATGVEMSRLHR